MARIRSIKADFWTDARIIRLSPYARLFYIGTWNFALCDKGHLPDDPTELKLKILPADDVDAHALLDELLAAGRLVRRRSSTGRPYLLIPRLVEHQRTDTRWQSRCPHCASEEADGFVEDPAEPPGDPPELAGTCASSRGLTRTRANSPQERIGEEGIGIQHATRAAAPASDAATRDPPMTITQRAKRITDAYAQAEPLCKWPAVNGVVIKAIKTERYADGEIRDALLRLAGEGRSVTVETLRVELNGQPPARASPKSTTDQRVAANLAVAAAFEAKQTKEITE